MARYQGWLNYETWAVNLWLENDQGVDRNWREQAKICYIEACDNSDDYPTSFNQMDRAAFRLADCVKDTLEELNPLTDDRPANLYTDLLQAALSEVNYDEIARAWLCGVVSE